MFQIGASLREARERRGLSYADAQAGTRIRARYLQLLEEERFDELPPASYVKGFLRSYADFLGLDGQLYVDEYRFRNPDDEPMPLAPQREPPPRRLLSRRQGIALLAVAGLGGAIFIAARSGPSTPSRSPLVLNGTGATRHHRQHHPASRPRKHAAPPRRHAAAAPTHGRAAPLRLVVRAVSGPSSLVVWQRGSTGQRVFDGAIWPGTDGHQDTGPLRSTTGFFIASASAPGNVVLSVNGHSYHLTGAGPWRVTRSGAELAPGA